MNVESLAPAITSNFGSVEMQQEEFLVTAGLSIGMCVTETSSPSSDNYRFCIDGLFSLYLQRMTSWRYIPILCVGFDSPKSWKFRTPKPKRTL